MTYRSLTSTLSIAAAVGLSFSLHSSSASACGGLFCSAAAPVNQAAERIIFADNGDGTVTAAIEIQYEGPAQSFAWVLPVPPGEVEVGVSSKVAFDRIDQSSNPSYLLNRSFDEGCEQPVFASAPSAGVADDADFAESEPSDPNVEVLAEGNAGPYDWQQIAVNPDLEDPAQVAIDWLTENGYDVGELGPDVLRPYLSQDMNLVAFRLTKGNEAGSIRPIMVSYESSQPFIPIRPTAVAANPDMGVKVWVLGDSRAIPENYLHLELNEVLINWFNPNANYNDVIIAAANDAGGHGFVTEQAGPAGQFTELAYSSFDQEIWDDLRTANFSSMEEFIQLSVNYFNSYDGFLDVMSDPEVVPLREGATAEQLVTCVSCYFQEDVAVRNDAYPETPYDPETDPLLDMDVQAFLDELDRLVIQPLADTRALFENNSTVTRLYTTLSADEMTVDPSFNFNPELEDVAQQRVANQVMQCDAETEWRIEFESGIVIHGNGNTWPVDLDSGMPTSMRVLQLSTSGSGDVVEDNIAAIGSMLVDLGIGESTEVEPPTPEEPSEEQTGDPPDEEDPPVTAETDDDPPEETDVESSEETDEEESDSEEAEEEGDDDPNSDEAGTDEVTVEESVAKDDAEDDDGCGCAVVGSSRSTRSSAPWLGLLGLAFLGRRRRR